VLIAKIYKGTYNSFRGEPTGGWFWDPEPSISSPIRFIPDWRIMGEKVIASRRETKNHDEV